MMMCEDEYIRYPCPICGGVIVSVGRMARKYCDNCLHEVRRCQALVNSRRNLLGWDESRVYEGVDPMIVKAVWGYSVD